MGGAIAAGASAGVGIVGAGRGARTRVALGRGTGCGAARMARDNASSLAPSSTAEVLPGSTGMGSTAKTADRLIAVATSDASESGASTTTTQESESV